MMSFAISLSNLKHNKKLYQVYFLAQLVIFSLFFMLQCFSTDSVIVARLAEDADIKTMIQTISLFFVLFIVFYFVYFNQFFIKQRAEELGIYSILGFKRQEIVRLFLAENAILVVIAAGLSLGVGYVLYFGMRTCLINFLGLDLPIWGLKIQSSAFKNMLLLILGIIGIVYIELYVIFRKKLTDILNLQKLQDKQVKRHPLLALSGLVCLLGADLLFSNLTTRPYSLWDQYGSLPVLFITLCLLGGGSVLFIIFTLPYVVSFLIHRPKKLYSMSGNVVLPRMQHRLQNKGRLLTALALLTTDSVMVLGVTFLTLSYPYEATKRIVPSTLETKIAKKRPLSTSEIKSFEQKFALKAVDSKLLQLKLKDKWYFSKRNTSDHIDVISLSNYNELMALQHREQLKKIALNEAVLVNYYASLAPVNESFTLKDGSQTLQVKKATNQNPFAFANSVVTVIVSDAKFNELAQKYPNASYAIVSFDGKNMRDNEKLVQAFKKTKVAYFSSYERNKLITNANSPTFLMISMISILFFVTISTILYFTARIEELSLSEEYDTLAKLGYRIKEIRHVVTVENAWLFFPPLILGLINGVFGILGASYLITDSLTTDWYSRLGQPLLYTIGLFLPIYLLVYYLAGRSIGKELKEYIEPTIYKM
ncbi:ABC transporter permease [Lactobacillus murinus]|nr:ABC transporter permease [Ligilactobacillus murinus]